MTRLVVVGGGIAGLTAAHHARTRWPEADVIVVEADDHPGGKLWTSPFAGLPVDWAADAFLARAPEAVELCTELGLRDQLVSPATRSASIYLDGSLRRLPPGLVLGVPVDRSSVEGTGLLDTAALDRLAAEADLGAEPTDRLAADETVGGFLRRRLGDAVVDRMVAPLLGGVNAGSVDELSIEAGTPQLAAARRAGGSFLAALRDVAAAADPTAPVFHAHPEGMRRIVEALVATLPAGTVRTGTTASGVDRRAGGWRVATTDGPLDADAVVLAVPGHVAAPWLEPLAPDTAAGLGDLGWASVAMVALALPRAAVADPLDGSGFLLPHGALGHRPDAGLLTACSWASTKWAHLAGDGSTVVLRASAGTFADRRADALDDAALAAALVEDLRPILGITGAPTEVRVRRWPASLPQYRPGHLDRVAVWEAELEGQTAGLALAGAALRGLGIPAVIRSARAAVDRVRAAAV